MLIQQTASVSPAWTAATAPDIAKAICIAAAKRAFVKPDMVASETIVAYTATFASSPQSVYLTKAEKAEIQRAAKRSGLWSQPTTRADKDSQGNQIVDTPSPWPLQYGPAAFADQPVIWTSGEPTP